jgi:hypothetical protein
VNALFCCGARVRSWHQTDMPGQADGVSRDFSHSLDPKRTLRLISVQNPMCRLSLARWFEAAII